MSTGTQESSLENLDRMLKDTFGWYIVSKKEFRDAIRSKGLWLLGIIFTSAFVSPVALALYFDVGRDGEALKEQGMSLVLSLFYLDMVTILLPIVAIFLGYAAISKERTTGSLKLLLSLPHSRRDVVVGKVIGRSGVLAVPLIASLIVTAIFFVISELTFKAGLFGTFGLFTVMFGIVFVSMTVSISAIFEKSSWSGIANFIVYFFFTFLWNALINGLGNALENDLGVSGAIRWHFVLLGKLLNPNQAYKTLVNSLLSESDTPELGARLGMFSVTEENRGTICSDVLNGVVETQQQRILGQVRNVQTCTGGETPVPFFYSDPAVFIFMLMWVGIAAAVSYYTFTVADL